MPEPQAATAATCEDGCPTCRALRVAVAPAVADAGLPLRLGALSRFANVDPGVARLHVGDDPGRVVVDAFEEAADDLLEAWRDGFRPAATWREGLEVSVQRVLALLAERPAAAHLCFVAARAGDRRLLAVADAHRQRFVQLLADEHARRSAGGEDLPPLQFEMLAGVLFRELGRILREGALYDPRETLVAHMLRTAQVFEAAA